MSMKIVDLMDYVKRAKDPANTKGCFIRFKIKKLDDGSLILVRNMVDRRIDNGAFGMSLILDKEGKPISLKDLPDGIVTIDEVDKMLNGAFTGLAVPSCIDEKDFNKFGWISSNLGGAELEYSAINGEEARYYDFPIETLSLNFLNTNQAFRKMGFAKRLLKEADKFAQLNKFKVMFGMGIPFDKDFCITNKTFNEYGFILQYQKVCKEKQIEFDPLGAIVNLALFYKRLGFKIYPMESGFFLIEKSSGSEAVCTEDELFLKASETELDEDAILFEK